MKILNYGEKYENSVALCVGFFDCVHKGHAEIIGRAKARAAALGAECAVLTFVNDPGVFLGKKKQLYTFRERAEALADLGVDVVVAAVFDEKFYTTAAEDFLNTLTSSLNPVTVVAGEDYTFGAGAKGNAAMLSDILGRKGIPVAILPLKGTENGKISSTEIKNAVERGDIAYANAHLTEPYFMLGKVGHAHGRGSTFGYPTANIPFGEDRLPPADGVYITSVTFDGKTYIGGTNVGAKPTFGDERPSVETFILDFGGDIYGKEIKLAFYKRLRDIEKFSSAAALAAQLDTDMSKIRNYFAEEHK